MQIVVTCDSYEELIAAAKQILKDHTDTSTPKAAKPAPVKKAEPKPEPAADPEPKEEPADVPWDKTEDKAVDESTVKVMLAGKIKGGKKAEVKALFEEYGVTKLSELMAKCPDKLAEFSEKAEAL